MFELDPLDGETWFIYGQIASLTGDYETAKSRFETALRIDPDLERVRDEMDKVSTIQLYDKAFQFYLPRIS